MFSKISLIAVISGLIAGIVLSGFSERVNVPKNNKPVIREIKVAAENVTLFVRIAGNTSSGNVLIGINGGPGQSSSYMHNLDRLAGDELAVVTYDQRGTGQSTEPSDGYELTAYAADLESVRKAVGIGEAHIFGHSWGGLIAMYYAALYPQNVRSIILMGSGPPTRKSAQAGQAELNKRIASLQEQGLIARTQSTNMKNLIELILPAYFSDPKFPIPFELKNTDFNPEASQQTVTALGDWDLSREVAGLKHPILLLWGEDDPFGLSMAEVTKNALSHAKVELVVLKGCGHYWHECADLFFFHVRAFLNLPSKHSGRQ
ncbi:MAG: alpha/beta hydrolase [Candidatus Aminicenantes bacterium]|nr:alpha/beta hydrolase [Candidatus Aminicenantes bacterium]